MSDVVLMLAQEIKGKFSRNPSSNTFLADSSRSSVPFPRKAFREPRARYTSQTILFVDL
jgi:hypothetical protein